jgi:hypothetical protein
VGLSHKPGVLSIHFEKCWQKMACAGWNNHLDGMSRKIPVISAGIWRKAGFLTTVSGELGKIKPENPHFLGVCPSVDQPFDASQKKRNWTLVNLYPLP